MNHVLSSIVLAFSSNVDNLSVAIAYGIMPRKIYFHHNVLIAVISGSGTWLSMSAGEWVNDYMSESFANVIGSIIMILIGLFNVVQAIRAEQKRFKGDEKTVDDLREGTHTREAFALAISLTFNNLGGGLGAGISHISIPLTTALTIGLSILAIIAGYQIGSRASLKISKLGLGIASGLLIMAVGVYEFFI